MFHSIFCSLGGKFPLFPLPCIRVWIWRDQKKTISTMFTIFSLSIMAWIFRIMFCTTKYLISFHGNISFEFYRKQDKVFVIHLFLIQYYDLKRLKSISGIKELNRNLLNI